MARTHTTTATTPSFQRSSSQLLLKPPPRNSFHSASIISVGDKIPAIPGFKTSAGEYAVTLIFGRAQDAALRTSS